MEKNESTVELIRAMLGNMPQPNYGSVSEDNIFKILSIENKELFHSKFLKYLIEKNWNSFITFLQSNDILANASGIDKLESIDCEYPYSCSQDCPQQKSGRFDLYIQAQKHTIAIEIKWYAGEQPYQLLRYYKALKKDNTEGTTLIFLTLNGKKGNSVKCDGCFQQCYLTEQNYKCLSFMEISEWINDILSTHPDTLLQQYNEILKDEISKMTISETLLKDIITTDKLFKAALTLENNMNAVRDIIREAFFQELCNAFREKGYTAEYMNKKLSVSKDGEVLAFVQYGTNLYCYRSKPDNDDNNKWSWWYIKPKWFNETYTDPQKPDSDSKKTKKSYKIDIAWLSGENNPVITWYFSKDEKKVNIINNIVANISNQLKLV